MMHSILSTLSLKFLNKYGRGQLQRPGAGRAGLGAVLALGINLELDPSALFELITFNIRPAN